MADMNDRPMLNAYPDSLGGTLGNAVRVLEREALRGVFSDFYVLPSLFNTDLDRGFSVIDYGLNELYATRGDLERLRAMGIGLKLDFILNHASVLSPQFQDILRNGENSPWRDFFIDWNKFWQGCGPMSPEGYIKPEPRYLEPMFFRKPGLPILMVRFPDGRSVPYWNTFYQEVRYPRADEQALMRALGLQYETARRIAARANAVLEAGGAPGQIDFSGFERHRDAVVDYLEARRSYLGQMDLNLRSPLVWDFYNETLRTLAGYGAKIVRLDAFAYAPKAPGDKNFLNEPETWELLGRVAELAGRYGLTLLPEIHSAYREGTHEKLSAQGYPCYDFFLPGLIIDALERGTGAPLARWAREIREKGLRVVNMLGCHDGIPLLDLKGLMPDGQIERLIEVIVSRGGLVKNLHGQKNMYYQVNATYFSALGEDEAKLLMARALQLFMPGKPQIWYLDLFACGNDPEAVRRAGPGGHKEINRTNLSLARIEEGLGRAVVREQLEMIRFRNTFPAFGPDARFEIRERGGHDLTFEWARGAHRAVLQADLHAMRYQIIGLEGGEPVCRLSGSR